jgi:tetratricopeptide (TPR) repeat protein
MTDWNRYHEIDALRESGHPAEALVEFKALRESATDAADIGSILLGEALSCRDLGRFDEAAEAASKSVRLLSEESPSRPYAEFCLACVHESQCKFDQAAQEFRALLKKHSVLLSTGEYMQFRRDVQLRLIANLITLGHAIEPLSIADALRTEDISPEERAELSYREAVAHGLLGRRNHALELYQEAISGPLDRSLVARAHFHIGEVLYDRGEFSRALDEFKIAESLADPSSPDKDHFAGWVKHTLRAAGNTGAEETVS